MASLPNLQVREVRSLDRSSPNGINKKPQPAKARLRDQPYEQWPEILSPLQGADVLDIGRNKMYRLLHAGQIASRKLGRTYHIPKAALRPKGDE